MILRLVKPVSAHIKQLTLLNSHCDSEQDEEGSFCEEERPKNGGLAWLIIFGAGLILTLFGMAGAFTVVSCGPPPFPGGVGLCITTIGYDYLAGIVGAVLVIFAGIRLVKVFSHKDDVRQDMSAQSETVSHNTQY